MSTKVNRLLARIQGNAGFKPEPGDVFKSSKLPGTFVVGAVGLRSSLDSESRVILFRNHRGEWRELYYRLKNWGRYDPESGEDSTHFRMVDVGNQDFIFGGFSPNNTGRSYVIFKRAAGVILRAGCRSFITYAQAAKHWRSGSLAEKASEKRTIAKVLFEKARQRGWLKVKRDRPVAAGKRKPRKSLKRGRRR